MTFAIFEAGTVAVFVERCTRGCTAFTARLSDKRFDARGRRLNDGYTVTNGESTGLPGRVLLTMDMIGWCLWAER